MMNILVYITKNNQVIVDPTVRINADTINGYTLKFEFQQPWDTALTLFAVFKPYLQPPIYIALDETNRCVIPTQVYRKFAKLGIGIKGTLVDETGDVIKQVTSDLFFIKINKSCGFSGVID